MELAWISNCCWFLLLWNGVGCVCPNEEWKQRKPNEASFYFSKTERDFNTSEKSCVQHDGNLASIHSQEEFDLVKAILRECGANEVWIGLKDPADNINLLEWTDGTPVDFKNKMMNLNKDWQNCVRMKDYDGQWVWWDMGCSTKYRYLCKKDFDECANSAHNCDAKADCTNTKGSFTCKCKTGYEGNGISCTDVNECTAKTHNCHANADCINTEGSYTCKCKDGFEGTGTICRDVDECEKSTHNCDSIANSICKNTIGSFICPCKIGYKQNGTACVEEAWCPKCPNPSGMRPMAMFCV